MNCFRARRGEQRIRRGGDVEAIDSAEATLQKIYKGQQFTISSDAGFDYLKTGASN